MAHPQGHNNLAGLRFHGSLESGRESEPGSEGEFEVALAVAQPREER